MYIFVYIITYSILVDSADIAKVVSDDEDTNQQIVRKAARNDGGYPMPRRFLEDLSDYEFHISHLRDPEFYDGRRHCKNSFEDKVRRYKKMLANDGSRVKYVSADAIPFNEKDLQVEDKCEEVPEETKVLKGNASIAEESKKVDRATEEKLEIKHSATTTPKPEQDAKVKKKISEEKRRASTYQFSSVEYYDEVPDFNPNVCPDDVQVITLQQDSIKAYDVECELMMQWESFKD